MRGRTWRSVASLVLGLVLGLVLVVAPGNASRHAQAAAPTYGANAGVSPGWTLLWESDAQLNADLDRIAATGAKWIRLSFDWQSIQYFGPSSWQWQYTDRVVHAARARGLSIVGGLWYTPPWARPAGCSSDKCPPADPAWFGTFARAAAQRYAPLGVRHWEVWNEPNNGNFFLPAPNVYTYVGMLQHAYVNLKAVDPGATVITGGTSPGADPMGSFQVSPVSWMQAVYAVGGRGYFDAVGHHPYSYPSNPLNGHPLNAFTQTRTLYDVMVANGDAGKRIWGTEVGAPTIGHGAITESQQQQWVRDYYTAWNTTYRDFTGPLLWYAPRDYATGSPDREDNFGLLRTDFSPKPAYWTFRDVMATPTGAVDSDDPPPNGLLPVTGTVARAVAAHPTQGYYVLGANGAVNPVGGAPYYGSPVFAWDIARDLAVMPDGRGYVVLDGFGGVHRFGSAAGTFQALVSPYWGWDIARSVVIAPSGGGFTVLDGWGGLHSRGQAPSYHLGYWPGWDIARSIAYSPAGGLYLLDGFGGLWRGGNATWHGAPYWGWDVARDVVATGSNGYVVLDAFGGLHRYGSAPGYTGSLWLPADRWRGVAVKPGAYVLAARY